MVQELVEWNGGKVARVARQLGVSRPALYAIMQDETEFETPRIKLAVEKCYANYMERYELIQSSVLFILNILRRAMVHCPDLSDDDQVLSRLIFLQKRPSVPQDNQIGFDVVQKWVDDGMRLKAPSASACCLMKSIMAQAIKSDAMDDKGKGKFIPAVLILVGLEKINVRNQCEMRQVMGLSGIKTNRWGCEEEAPGLWYSDAKWHLYINRLWSASKDACKVNKPDIE